MATAKRVCVVGAGASGLPSIKTCLEEGFDVICYEKSVDIGGLWRYKPTPCPGEGTVMKSTVINTSKEMTAYSDFPPPAEAANFMHNAELLQYFRDYAKHFDLKRYIKFQHEVLSIKRVDDFSKSGQWEVVVRDKTVIGDDKTEIFDSVMICCGHHTDPYRPPAFHGEERFRGAITHSHDYRDYKGFDDKVVVVVGIGNSGADICVELSKVAKKVYLATRSGSWIINRIWYAGEPADLAYLNRFTFGIKKMLPAKVQNDLVMIQLEKRFDHGRFGLRPKHRPLEAHVTINDELPNRIISGTVIVKPNISSFTERGIVFEDNTLVDEVDHVILATGYSFGFPLIEQGNLIRVDENRVSLFKYVYSPELATESGMNTLAVIGLIQPTGSIMPISEMQARVHCAQLAGRIRLPAIDLQVKDIEKTRKKHDRQFIASRRHTIQVFYVDYMDELARLFGCRPNIAKYWLSDPTLARRLLFHGLVPYQYRLEGSHAWSGAREAIIGVEERVFEATRTRRTPETMRSKPLWQSCYWWHLWQN